MNKPFEISKKVKMFLSIRFLDVDKFTMMVQDQEDGEIYYVEEINLEELEEYKCILGISADGSDFDWLDTGCLREVK